MSDGTTGFGAITYGVETTDVDLSGAPVLSTSCGWAYGFEAFGVDVSGVPGRLDQLWFGMGR